MSLRPGEQPRVLIVEDEAVTALDLSTELQALGYVVCGVVDTEDEAVAAAVRERPALVLMDVRLADGGDGIATAGRIAELHDAAIVFLTAHSDEATLARALDVSPFGYLIKPFRARELKVTLELAIAKHSKDIAATRSLQSLAATDPLTGLANRRELNARLGAAWARCSEEGRPLAVLMVDIDHFKLLNDTQGHLSGDECLHKVAAILGRVCDAPDAVFGRWGGEEFLAVLPGLDQDSAAELAERMVRGVRRAALPHIALPSPAIVTVSIGVAAARPPGSSSEGLVALADRGLYHAKELGRDRAARAP